jgi:hypothetical protein
MLGADEEKVNGHSKTGSYWCAFERCFHSTENVMAVLAFTASYKNKGLSARVSVWPG